MELFLYFSDTLNCNTSKQSLTSNQTEIIFVTQFSDRIVYFQAFKQNQ